MVNKQEPAFRSEGTEETRPCWHPSECIHHKRGMQQRQEVYVCVRKEPFFKERPTRFRSRSSERRKKTKLQLRSGPEKLNVQENRTRRNPKAVVFSEWEDCENQAEYLAQSRVKAWKHHKEMYETKGTLNGSSFVIVDMGTRKKQPIANCHISWRPGVQHRRWRFSTHDMEIFTDIRMIEDSHEIGHS